MKGSFSMNDRIGDNISFTNSSNNTFHNSFAVSPQLPYIVINGIILSFGILGNGIVIFYFGAVRRCKKNYELLILLLGAVDWLSFFPNFLLHWSVLYTPVMKWKLGEFGCKYLSYVSSINLASS